MDIIPTKLGLRLSQHGVVISELRTTPGPTHSVFDVLAALLVLLRPAGRIGMLGFAGGGMLAPLQALGMPGRLEAVDLDRTSYKVFSKHCPEWAAEFQWEHAEAGQWLRRRLDRFDLLLDDLSIPRHHDVTKPAMCWRELPELMRQRLEPNGVAVFNLLPPAPGGWGRGVNTIARWFAAARLVLLNEFENRILVAGNELPSARILGGQLRRELKRIGSRQAGQLRVKTVK